MGEVDKVYDSQYTTWIHDIAQDEARRPVIVFAVIDTRGTHHYRYARWDGSRWRQSRITPAGGSIADNGAERLYSGGITLDHENPSVVYLSRQVKGMFEVERWRTPDGGQSWIRKVITSGSTDENVRPVSPLGMRSFTADMSVLWMRGNYRHYVDYRTDLTTVLLNGGNLPPQAEAVAKPRGGPAPHSVRFNAAPAHDPDGRIVRWVWHFGDGTSARGPKVTHEYTRPGRYFATLTVTDDAGDQDAYVVEVNARG